MSMVGEEICRMFSNLCKEKTSVDLVIMQDVNSGQIKAYILP